MEYFVGAITTLAIVVVVSYFIKRSSLHETVGGIRYSQSHIHNLLAPLLPDNEDMVRKTRYSQADKHWEKVHIRILTMGKKAYWIKENVFYVANIVNGEIDEESTKQVDTMAMDKVQLDKMLYIVEELTRGRSNDYWNSGKS
jgi:hypothetical protein